MRLVRGAVGFFGAIARSFKRAYNGGVKLNRLEGVKCGWAMMWKVEQIFR